MSQFPVSGTFRNNILPLSHTVFDNELHRYWRHHAKRLFADHEACKGGGARVCVEGARLRVTGLHILSAVGTWLCLLLTSSGQAALYKLLVSTTLLVQWAEAGFEARATVELV